MICPNAHTTSLTLCWPVCVWGALFEPSAPAVQNDTGNFHRLMVRLSSSFASVLKHVADYIAEPRQKVRRLWPRVSPLYIARLMCTSLVIRRTFLLGCPALPLIGG